jgi:pimeloyl-ACP methyl ester carboxylesterase
LQGLQNNFAETVQMINKFSWRRASASGSKDVAVQHMLSTDAQIVHDDFFACSQFDLRDRLGGITLSTLVIGGSEDKMMPLEQSEALVAGIANAELLVIEDAGHYMMVDKTSKVSRGLVKFLNELG